MCRYLAGRNDHRTIQMIRVCCHTVVARSLPSLMSVYLRAETDENKQHVSAKKAVQNVGRKPIHTLNSGCIP